MVDESPGMDARWLWLWTAWSLLQTSRPIIAGGMGPPITLELPWGIIEDYGQRVGFGLGERMMLHNVIGALDRTQISHDRAEAKRHADEAPHS